MLRFITLLSIWY